MLKLQSNFWTDFGAWAVASGWVLLQVAAIIIGAFVLAWILRVVIRRVVRQIVSGVKKNQNVTDTQALVVSPLAAVRVVQRTRTLGTVLSNVVNVTIGIIAIILVFDKLAPNALGSLALLDGRPRRRTRFRRPEHRQRRSQRTVHGDGGPARRR